MASAITDRDGTKRRLQAVLQPMPEADSAEPARNATPVVETEASAEHPYHQPVSHTRPIEADESHRLYRTQRGRFRRTVMFFSLTFFRVLFWEVVLRRLLGETIIGRGRTRRWRLYARRFRKLAIDMGGVMIKLGQFVSTRVDVLPPEITDELTGLQDQVPIVGIDYIRRTIERELGPLDQRFLWFNPEPIAAASFGQVHRAQLLNGDRVVVKVQRPNITDIVQTDLAALRFVARLAMRYGPIRRRANVPALLDEFSRVLWEELDYRQEANNALTFASMFEDDHGIYVPSVYLEHSTHCVLTLEDVTSIKVNDYGAIERAGVDRKEVARRLLHCYFEQIFDYRFFHADPHPGNLFVYPLPEKHQNGRPHGQKAFYLIFIDFGMTGSLTDQLVRGLRETLIAVITQDPKGLVASYKNLGILMPDADVARLEQATQAVFSKVWGLNMDQMRNLPMDEVTNVAMEFSDLLLSMPFQMPQDFIYLSRTVSILSGMCTGLDPNFDPWKEIQPFAQKLLDEPAATGQSSLPIPLIGQLGGLFAQTVFKNVRNFATRAYRLPSLADTVLDRADKGELVVQVKPDADLQRQISRLQAALNQIAIGILFATTMIVSTIMFTSGERGLSYIWFGISVILLVMVIARGRR